MKRICRFLFIAIIVLLTSCAGDVEKPESVEKTIFTVKFNLNGHGNSAPKSVQVNKNSTLPSPTSPYDENYYFSGWFKEKACINVWDFENDTVNTDLILYAKWRSDGPCPHEVLSQGIAQTVATNNKAATMRYLCDDCGERIVISDSYPINNSLSVAFSENSKFSSDSFELIITATPGSVIYYTLDGSVPTDRSSVYAGPILITDASSKDNYYSNITNLSVRPNTVAPVEKVDKCTVVRAMCIKDGEKSKTVSASYYVGFNEKIGYNNINIVSIIVDPTSLFDYNYGILVPGKTFDDYKKNTPNYQNASWQTWGANYRNEGRDWEREIYADFFETTKELSLSKKLGMRVKGGWSRSWNPRSFNIYAREEYDDNGKKNFGYSFWSDSYSKARKISLAAGGNDYIVNIKDYIVCEALKQSGVNENFSYFHFSPYSLFLNGEYWGVYFITEKYDDHYLKQKYGVDDNNVLVIKTGSVEEGNESDKYLYDELIAYFNNPNFSYEEVCNMIDIESFINYYAVEMYIHNPDWVTNGHNNYQLWRTVNNDSGSYGDKKWRWMLYDINSDTMKSPSRDFLIPVINSDKMFAKLWEYDEFKTLFCDKMISLCSIEFNPSTMDSIIDAFSTLMREPSAVKYKRFFGSDDYLSTFDSTCSSLKSFFTGRATYISEKYTEIKNSITSQAI